MKVLISWASDLSQQAARVIRDWLPTVLPSVDPWFSDEDIPKGARWLNTLLAELQDTQFGIVCITPGSDTSPWINFEVGALSKSVDQSKICPLLIGVEKASLQGPLSQFQAASYDEAELLKLVASLNASSEKPLPETRVRQNLEQTWLTLKTRLDPILAKTRATRKNNASAGPAVAPTDARPPLDPEMLKVLAVMGQGETDQAFRPEVLAAILEVNATRMLYYLETLEHDRYVYSYPASYDSPTLYGLSRKGRALLAGHKLI